MNNIEIFKKIFRKAPKWHLIGETVRGASHVHSGLVNQDGIKWVPQHGGDCYAIMAVADGHGSAKHFRSDRGARMAVEEATAMLGDYWKAHKKKEEDKLSSIKNIAEEWLPKRLHQNWKEKVMADMASDPVVESELERLKEKNPALVNNYQEKPLSVYGTTLLALLVTPTYRLAIRLGDGDILAVTKEGCVQEILPEGIKVGDETDSLGNEDAWQRFKVSFQLIREDSPVMYLLATDGYKNSFTTKEGFLQVGPDYLKMLKESGKEDVIKNLNPWLEDTSQKGSGDDITLGIVFREMPEQKE